MGKTNKSFKVKDHLMIIMTMMMTMMMIMMMMMMITMTMITKMMMTMMGKCSPQTVKWSLLPSRHLITIHPLVIFSKELLINSQSK